MSYISTFEKRKNCLLQAVQFFGSQRELSRQIGIDRHQYNKCINGDLDLPLHHAIVIQKKTKGKIRVKDIAPSKYKLALDIIEDWSSKAESQSTYLIPINSIHTSEIKFAGKQKTSDYYSNRAIILDDLRNDFFNLVTGKISFAEQKNYGTRKVQAKVFSFTKIFEDNGINFQKFIKENHLLISEKTEIGLYIEGFIGGRQGKRTDLKTNLQLRDNYPEVNSYSRTREFIINLIGFTSDYTYRQTKKIISQGSNLLIEVVDRQILTISKAFTMINTPQRKQLAIIEQTIQKKKLAIEPDFFNHWRPLCQ